MKRNRFSMQMSPQRFNKPPGKGDARATWRTPWGASSPPWLKEIFVEVVSLCPLFLFVLESQTHVTFFCVHSRSFRTAWASSSPWANRALVLARRACALACSSRTSRCFAFRPPELRWIQLANCSGRHTHSRKKLTS